MFIFHYIMEYFGSLSSPYPLHEQPKDEILFLGTAQCVPNSLTITRKHFTGNVNTTIRVGNNALQNECVM